MSSKAVDGLSNSIHKYNAYKEKTILDVLFFMKKDYLMMMTIHHPRKKRWKLTWRIVPFTITKEDKKFILVRYHATKHSRHKVAHSSITGITGSINQIKTVNKTTDQSHRN